MTHSHASTRRLLALAAGLWLCGTAVSAQAPTAAVLFERATARETELRAAPAPAPADVRRTIAAYELVVRKFPRSGYCDNALWQAAGVALLAYRQANRDADRANGERLLQWLTSQYPASPFAKQAAERLQAFSVPGAAIATASRTPPASPPSPPSPASSPSPDVARAVLRSISREAIPSGDRIVVEVDREVAFTSDRIDNPDRVFLDLSGTSVGDGVPAAASALKGMLVTSVRLGHPAPGTTRIVVNLAGSPKQSIYPLYNPYRLVIDAEGPPPPPLVKSVVQDPLLNLPAPATPAATTVVPPPPAPVSAPPPVLAPIPSAVAVPKLLASSAVTPVPPPNTMRNGNYSLARQLGLSVQRIVIDAGHGGHDPGAEANGIVEKDLVLDVALRLQKLLEAQPGMEVVLTRDTDQFIPLEERTAIANRANADLFLSIHANASSRKDARGLETYFLNFATNPEAEAVAARENATSSQSMGQLPEILKAIALNTKVAESRELAMMVQTSMVRRLKTQNTSVRDLGVKQAPFVVLIGAQMPSVLAEISFVTNRADASSLKQASSKQRIAQALFDAIVKYQASLKKVTTVAAKTSRQSR